MTRPRGVLLAGFVAAALSGTTFAQEGGDPSFLQPGDHVCIIGNTTGERMQHDGWLETKLEERFPNPKLVVRTRSFPGDELTLPLRSMAFGKPDEWLTRCKADVVFAFFGFNESFQG